MGMLTDRVQVVIGVDTHKHTHTAAVVASTGAHLAERTVAADPAGYRMLLEAAAAFPGARLWAIEGTAGYRVPVAGA
jgi:transposase